MSVCDGCVFCGSVKGTELCGRSDGFVDMVKARVEAKIAQSCDKKMTREDVLRMSRQLRELRQQRDAQRELLDTVQRVISGILKGDQDNAEKIEKI